MCDDVIGIAHVSINSKVDYDLKKDTDIVHGIMNTAIECDGRGKGGYEICRPSVIKTTGAPRQWPRLSKKKKTAAGGFVFVPP